MQKDKMKCSTTQIVIKMLQNENFINILHASSTKDSQHPEKPSTKKKLVIPNP